MEAEEQHTGTLEGLSQRVRGGLPPVELWHPPYCGDIGLRIRRDGSWLYRDSPIRREALVRLFASVLRKDADGGTYLVTPAEKVDVTVEDAPFVAVAMDVSGAGHAQQLVVRTNVDDVVRCGAQHPLRFALQVPGGGLKPYVLVRGRLEALFARPLVYELVDLLVGEVREGRAVPGVWSGGTFFPVEPA